MNRRGFFKRVGAVLGIAVLAKEVPAQPETLVLHGSGTELRLEGRNNTDQWLVIDSTESKWIEVDYQSPLAMAQKQETSNG